jgi:hypothetical protein
LDGRPARQLLYLYIVRRMSDAELSIFTSP